MPAACGVSTNNAGKAPGAGLPKRGGNLKLGLAGGSSSDSIDPHKGVTYLDAARLQALYNSLVQPDAQANIEYVLAESITPDKALTTEWIIRLRPGITFHGGKDLTADDVLYHSGGTSPASSAGRPGSGLSTYRRQRRSTSAPSWSL